MLRLLLSLLLIITGCASTSHSGIVARNCGVTAQEVHELEHFGFQPAADKISVFRIFATWCPYCKDDLMEIGKRFRSGQWSADKISILLLAYKNRNEDKDSFAAFKQDLERFGIPKAALQLQYVDKDFAELSQYKGKDGHILFDGWRGVPFGLVFGKDGRMVFRGHFTNSPPIQDHHYDLITELSQESCHP